MFVISAGCRVIAHYASACERERRWVGDGWTMGWKNGRARNAYKGGSKLYIVSNIKDLLFILADNNTNIKRKENNNKLKY